MITEMNERSREIMRLIVEAYTETGSAVGSRTLSRRLELPLSPATVRNAMADLEERGLLYSPHTSSGRLPTEAGLRMFVDGLLEIGNLTDEERSHIDIQCAATGRSSQQVLEEATDMLSGLSSCAGLVMAPTQEGNLRHVEFVPLSPGRALVVLVGDTGMVENRVIDIPVDLPASKLIEATNFLSAKLVGRTLAEVRCEIDAEIGAHRDKIDELTKQVVDAGLATWSEGNSYGGVLIVRGQAKLLNDVTALGDLERIRSLFEVLETKEALLRLLEVTERGEGVQIFIGAENELFSLSGCSMIIAPYQNHQEQIVGAIGVIGPTHMNYARIIPMVDYTAKLVGRVLG
ncbi:MAG: heat-inducible transcriptional repressor HrcA [Pseudomonadota bacterium]|nr:heat-inducible transcriptional repressor HrcA [Pseudomonadota bacterium]